ncbi:MAG: DUF4198 domain-containing protein [Gemmobacter sp.]
MVTMKRACILAAVLIGLGQMSLAHEFWLEPVAPRVAAGDSIAVTAHIGEMFDGPEVRNFASMQRAVDLTLGNITVPVRGEEGQSPAFQAPSLGDGLHVLRYHSRDHQLTYDDYSKFTEFLAEAGREDLAEAHDARGLSRDNIREVYFRYAKSLIAVGSGDGADRYLGMPLELVALNNPYTEPKKKPVRFQLLFLGEQRANAAVHVFIRPTQDEVVSLRLRTDANGEVTVPADIPGLYMVNAIHILPASPRMETLLGAVWQSLWASSTYAIE